MLVLYFHQLVAQLCGELQVVCAHEYGLALVVGESGKSLHYGHLAGIIEKGGRLVEHDDGCMLCQGFGYHHLLALAVAQSAHASGGERGYAYRLHCLADEAAVVVAQPAPEPRVGGSAHAHHLCGGERGGERTVGEHHAHEACHLGGAHGGDVASGDGHRALYGWLKTAQRAQ